jgi:hypothetical protein
MALVTTTFRSESEAGACIVGGSGMSDGEEWRVTVELYWSKATWTTRDATRIPVSLH